MTVSDDLKKAEDLLGKIRDLVKGVDTHRNREVRESHHALRDLLGLNDPEPEPEPTAVAEPEPEPEPSPAAAPVAAKTEEPATAQAPAKPQASTSKSA